MMKKLLIPAILVIGLIILMGSNYNRFMGADQRVQEQMGQLQNEVQRQSDLIPNLVNTVKGYATHEHDTLTDYAAARSGETPLNRIDPRSVSDEALQKKNPGCPDAQRSGDQGHHRRCRAVPAASGQPELLKPDGAA
ncbi:uncharacterized conserved protein [Gluconobacter frateurii NBRC 103465]|nr:uncharacterized conserved protein [Gluconobacter frateurii NBRC 103465]